MNAAALPESCGWHAELALGFASRDGRTRLAWRKQRGPLAVQRPFHPEGEVCHLYLLHPPGGVVGGDRLEIGVDVAAGAHALLTTPGATKFYRSAGDEALQRQRLSVTDGATLEWFPQENIFFPGARAALKTEIELHGTARFMGWEIQCLGRPANREAFTGGGLSLRLQLYRDGRPLLLERLAVNDGAGLNGAATLRGHPVTATFVATGVDAELRDRVRDGQCAGEGDFVTATLLDDLLVVRYLGHSTEAARKAFVAAWSLLRPALWSREACPPRIWAT